MNIDHGKSCSSIMSGCVCKTETEKDVCVVMGAGLMNQTENSYKLEIWSSLSSFPVFFPALGSFPLISIVGYVDGGIQLLCLSSGWFPQPTVKWKGPQGQHLSSDSRANADGHNLYDVETSIIVQENAGSISCSIHLAEQSHEVESKVLIGGEWGEAGARNGCVHRSPRVE